MEGGEKLNREELWKWFAFLALWQLVMVDINKSTDKTLSIVGLIFALIFFILSAYYFFTMEDEE